MAPPGESRRASSSGPRSLARMVAHLVLGLLVLALVTVVCFEVGFRSTPTAFLYLIIIVLLSRTAGFIPAAVVSGLAIACLNYVFISPSSRYGTTVNVLELGAFLITALVTTRLVSRSTRAARLLEERARLLDLAHDAVFVRDMEGRIAYWSRGAEELYGWTAGEALGRVAQELLQTEFPDPFTDVSAELLRAGSWQGELVHTTRDGRRAVVAARCAVERDDSGEPVAFLVTTNDITERKRAEEALRKSEEKWRAVFEHNPTMYFMVDPGGIVASVNPFGAEQLGYTVAELVGRPVLDVFLDVDREAARRHVAACLEHPGQVFRWELRKVRKDGTIIWVRETGNAMPITDGGLAVLVVCEDITQQKRAEDELRASEARFRTLVDHASDAFFLCNGRGNIIDVNRQACESYGYTREELIRMNAFDLSPDVDADRNFIRDNFPPSETGVFTFETRHRRKDGTLFPVEVRARRFVEGGHHRIIGLLRDITTRKQAEQALRETQAVLTHVTRVTTLGEVTASFAHELNQPLAAIVNNANACLGLLANAHQDLGEVCEALADIVTDAGRAGAIIERVRALAKRSAPEHVALRLGDVVSDVLALAAAEAAARRVTIDAGVPADLPSVLGDRVQLQQVLLNLVVNAMDAMAAVDERERCLRIRGLVDAEDKRRAVTISVADCGVGLEPDRMNRLFDAFYTTKPHGMGLGLAISRSIIEAHSGRLWAEGNARAGATFSFRLPAFEAA
jgi:PAS domain S-box-containing protein